MCGERAGWTRGPHSSDYLPTPKPVFAPEHERPNWGTARTGIGLMIVGLGLFWISSIVVALTTTTASDVQGQFAFATFAVAMLATYSSVVLFVAGVVCGIFVPARSAGRAWAIATIALQALTMLFVIDVITMQRDNDLVKERGFTLEYDHLGRIQQKKADDPPHHPDHIAIRAKTAVIMATISQLFILLFPWSLAKFLHQPKVARSALLLFVVAVVFDVLLLIELWSAPASLRSLVRGGDGSITELLTAGAIGLSIWFLVNLVVVRRGVTRLVRGESIEPVH